MSRVPGPLTLGTAGHIDHGKTALVRALTGVETDRLPEERARGISIALGYAFLRTPAGRAISVVDVPGHERFMRTMVAGATGVDLFLMVISADDGVMPQTIEHARVLHALDVERGVVAVTKADLADPGPAREQARELLPACASVACSARTGAGLDDLVRAIDRVAAQVPGRVDRGGAVLHVDRIFSVQGHGTVVTGTLWSGSLAVGDMLDLLPSGARVRARGLETHGASVAHAEAGQRVAVNLAGARVRDVQRGDVLATPGLLRETSTLDCLLELTEPPPGRRVQVHHGTRETPGRMVALDEDFWQLRLERPLIAADGDRVVVRRPTPPDTLGGGVILDAHARRHGRRPEILERLRRRRDGKSDPEPAPVAERDDRPPEPVVGPPADQLRELERRLREAGARPLSAAQLDVDPAVLRASRAAGVVVRLSGELYMHADVVDAARLRLLRLLERDQTVTLPGIRDALGISRKAAQALLEHFDTIGLTRRLPDERRALSGRSARIGTRA